MIGALLCALCAAAPAGASDGSSSCSCAAQSARAGDYDSAYMYYRSALQEGAGSGCAEQALFAQGEFYYLKGARLEAISAFSRFARLHPESPARPYALVYLIAAARSLGSGDSQAAQDLERHIATLQQVSLLFRKQKKHSYLSPMRRKHTMVYYIDKVECYADGKLLAGIAY